MFNKVMKRKTLALLMAGGAMFQLGGCGEFLVREAAIGFGRSLGGIPAGIVVPILQDIVNGIIPANDDDGDGDGDG